jgi:hypothetical protein
MQQLAASKKQQGGLLKNVDRKIGIAMTSCRVLGVGAMKALTYRGQGSEDRKLQC